MPVTRPWSGGIPGEADVGTVEMTLSKVYRKLAIRSRARLYAAVNPE